MGFLDDKGGLGNFPLGSVMVENATTPGITEYLEGNGQMAAIPQNQELRRGIRERNPNRKYENDYVI